ncbi:MAG: hypothetical protein KJO69_08980, partial [Gammaproteobacteria bacterium]|nr:hypothetical protein [Gammaproteobacteria bacterium]
MKKHLLLSKGFLLILLGLILPNLTHAQTYCTTNFTITGWSKIGGVKLEGNTTDIDNQTTACNGYEDFTTLPAADLSAGGEYTLVVDKITCSANYQFQCGAWIDYNNNKSFEASEYLGNRVGANGATGTVSWDFTVPCTINASTTRLRVVLWEDGTPGPCTQSAYGQSEDYSVKLATSPGLNSDFFVSDTVFVNTIASFVNANQSGYIGHEWTIDGSSYTTTNAEHIFTSTGTFDVKLKSTNCNGSDSTTKQVVVINPSAPPAADFVSTKNIMEIFESFQLIDLSTNGPTNWDWYMHNGGGDTIYVAQGGDPYTHKNPNVFTGTNPAGIPKIFPDEGKWTVCLKSSNGIGSSSTVCKTDYLEVRRTSFSIGPETSLPANVITATSGAIYDKGGPNNNYPLNDANLEALIAPCGAQSVTLNFNMFKVLANGNLKVYDGTNALGVALHSGTGFTAGNEPTGPLTASSGAMYLLWNSGPGTSDSGFAATWTSVAGSGAAPVADFDLPADTIYNAVFENFINTSLNAEGSTTFEWSVNGTPIANTRDLENQIYLTNGTYTITLKVFGCDGSTSSKTKTFFVANPDSPTELDFMADTRRPAVGDQVTFSAMSDKANRWEWSFFPPVGVQPTGIVSDALDVRTFQFSEPGVYAVQLKGYNYNATPDSSVSENTVTKTQYIVVVEH